MKFDWQTFNQILRRVGQVTPSRIKARYKSQILRFKAFKARRALILEKTKLGQFLKKKEWKKKKIGFFFFLFILSILILIKKIIVIYKNSENDYNFSMNEELSNLKKSNKKFQSELF